MSRLENAHKAHPAVRLAAWVHYVCRSLGLETPGLDCLWQLELIDQVGFPLLVGEAGDMDLDSCLSFYKSGDYTDLEWMAEAIVHGHAMNWAQVREAWHHQFISDPSGFSHLLAVCADPEAVLTALSPKNLCLLINASDLNLSRLVLEHYPLAEAATETEESPYFAAAWFLLRNAERSGADYSDAWTGHLRRSSLLAVLRWASEFAFHLLDVLDDPEGRQRYVQRLLVRESVKLAPDARRDRDALAVVIGLWSNIFAPLLVVGPEGIPYDLAYMIAKSQHPPKPAWPPFVRTLCNVAHGATDPTEVDALYDHPFFYEFGSLDHTFAIPPEILACFLGLDGGGLSKRWQIRLLTSPVVLDDRAGSLKQKKNLMLGLGALASRDDIKVKGAVAAELLEIYDRMHPNRA